MEKKRLGYIGKMVDLTLRTDYTGRGIIDLLWNATSSLQPNPISMSAAERLYDIYRNGPAYVLIITGTMVRTGFPKIQTETDGPIGAAVLARALWRGFSTVPIFITMKENVRVIGAAAQAAGFTSIHCSDKNISRYISDDRLKRRPIAIVTYLSDGADKAIEMAESLLNSGSIGSVISIEMVGRNQLGIAHSVSGIPKDNDILPWFDKIFEVAQNKAVLTIGIGDGGNEIGMGKIRDTLEKVLPSANCGCSCSSTIIAAQSVDLLVPAVISNWGAYGIALCLAAHLNSLDVFHNVAIENRILASVVSNGAVDGTSNLVEECVDGLTREENASYVELLRCLLVKNSQNWSLK